MTETKRDWNQSDPAAGLAWAIRESMRLLIGFFANDEHACVTWFVNLYNLLKTAREGGTTNVQSFRIIQFGTVPEFILEQAKAGELGWEMRVRKFVHDTLNELGLEPPFLREVWNPDRGEAS